MLKFGEKGVGCLMCSNCKQRKEFHAKHSWARTRLSYIFDFVLAALRTQGYNDGYLCLRCEKNFGVNTKGIRKRCKKFLTSRLFRERETYNIKVK